MFVFFIFITSIAIKVKRSWIPSSIAIEVKKKLNTIDVEKILAVLVTPLVAFSVEQNAHEPNNTG